MLPWDLASIKDDVLNAKLILSAGAVLGSLCFYRNKLYMSVHYGETNTTCSANVD